MYKRKRTASADVLKRAVKRAREGMVKRRASAAVVRALKAEQRWKLYEVGGSVSTTPTDITFTSMAEGDDIGQRSGRSIVCDKLEINWTCTGADSPANIVRIIVYRDLRNNAAGPSGVCSALLQSGTSYPWIAQYEPTYASRFQILRDIAVTLNQAGETVKAGKMVIDLKGVVLNYASSSATDPMDGPIFMGIVSDSSITTHPTYIISSTLHYGP